MQTLKTLTATFALGLAGLTGPAATAEGWPGGNVQLIVPSKPGGGTDIMARIFADYLARETGGNVVVVNQPAGGGAVAAEQVLTSQPDGLTLLFQHTGQIVTWHTGRSEVPPSDFTIVGIAQSYPPQVYAVAPDAPWATMKEFVDDARGNPGAHTVGVQLGGTSHFIAGTIMMNEGVELKTVEASAEVDKVAAIQGGHLDLGNLGAGPARQYVEAGDMKVLCLIDPEPNPNYPEFDTCIEQGVNVSWIAPLVIWGPKDMDPELVAEINASFAGMADDPVAQEQLANADSIFKYFDVAAAQTLIAGEDEKIGALATTLGLSAR